MNRLPPLSLYLHIPWCRHKCPYCDFNSHQLLGSEDFALYRKALLLDLELELPLVAGRRLESIFIGGGTPSLFGGGEIGRLLRGIGSRVDCRDDMEITLEANPGVSDSFRFSGYREAGVNRLSLGIQSFNSQSLTGLERIHGPEEALGAFNDARAAGFNNINLDLMFGLPGQSPRMAAEDLYAAVELLPEHISYYQLTLEPNTRFAALPPPALPGEEQIWQMQSEGQRVLLESGYAQYEVSAFSRPGSQCVHNLNYWRFGDYLGLGAGAHGKLTVEGGGIVRRWRVRGPSHYLKTAGTEAALGGSITLTENDIKTEFMMNLLRLNEGFSPDFYQSVTGLEFTGIEANLKLAQARGLVSMGPDEIRCTNRGRRFLNDTLAFFL